jgi:hypothetical protein
MEREVALDQTMDSEFPAQQELGELKVQKFSSFGQ